MSHDGAVHAGSGPRDGRTLVVVLGAPNDPEGRLSEIALSRLRAALAEYRSDPSAVLLPTGGYGEHFNTSTEAHAVHAARWLLEAGVPESDIVDHLIDSGNTQEDAEGLREFLDQQGSRLERVVVVTSDFHLARARLVFEQELPDVPLRFAAAPTDPETVDLDTLHEHEREAIGRLRRGGQPQ